MAIYVTSDLHGFAPVALEALLDKAGFCREDWLFILGDVIDRNGDGGVSTLLWLLRQTNVQLLLGNHEQRLLECRWVFDEITADSVARLDDNRMGLLSEWLANGASPTLQTLKALWRRQPEAVDAILDYLQDAPLYETVSAGGRDFVLTHAGLGNFSPDKKLSAYTPRELLWTRPELEARYFSDVMTVFGHTPTIHYGKAYAGQALKTDTWIDVDTGAAGGGTPMLLRLDDLAEFYV